MKRVLLVDDEPAIREMLIEYLRGRGLDVHACADAESAIARLDRERPDIVLTDMKLPGNDGLSVVRAATTWAVPVVVTTGFATVESTIEAYAAGAREYLLKPFRLRDLYAALERAVAVDARERRARWSETALALLVEADAATDEGAAEALVPALESLLRRAPGVETVRFGADGIPLGHGRAVDIHPLTPAARLCIAAVDRALTRVAGPASGASSPDEEPTLDGSNAPSGPLG